jgi:hypothetical protein
MHTLHEHFSLWHAVAHVCMCTLLHTHLLLHPATHTPANCCKHTYTYVHLAQVSSDCLPPLLESLALKYVLLSNPGSFGAAVRELSTLSLTHCAAPRLPPGEGLRQLLVSLEGCCCRSEHMP